MTRRMKAVRMLFVGARSSGVGRNVVVSQIQKAAVAVACPRRRRPQL